MADTRDSAVRDTLLQLNARAWGISFGLLMGGGLFLATIVLVVKGGPMVGQHLNLISAFFPGYRVTWLGAFIGFMPAFFVSGVGMAAGVYVARRWVADYIG